MTRAGLTLVETLAGLALLGLLSLLGLSALGLVGQAGRAAATEATGIVLAQDLLRLRLQAAQPVLEPAPGGRATVLFDGGPERLAFVAELPPRFGLRGLAVVEITREGEAVLLRWRPLAGPAAGEGAAGRRLVEGAEALRLRYFGAPDRRAEAAWRTEWRQADVLPSLVAVEVVLAGQGRGWPLLVVAPRLAPPAEGARS